MAGGPVAGGGSPGTVEARLDLARRDLLDLGLRNPLINFRLLKSRGVEVVDELPAEVFRLLVKESRSMTFLPAPEEPSIVNHDSPAEEPPSHAAAAQTRDLPGFSANGQPEEEAAAPAARHVDRRLQTRLSSADLQKRLLTTFYDARTILEEQGVNILHLVVGMLEWYEDDKSAQIRRAPLILIPVELNRTDALDRFHLRYTEEDIGANLSLEAKLKVDFGIDAPQLPDTEDLDVADYLAQFERAIRHQRRWRIDRDSIVLSFFSFGKFLMFRDLDPATWPDEAVPSNHPIIRALLGDGFGEPPPSVPDDVFLDHTPEGRALKTVVDADSTQSLAILDVAAGRNLVVQGPPGTGKSQTITNVIAQAIGDGKRVLFVAEKMAALEVVKRRLDQIGLGDACLELHSHRTTKRSLLHELQRTLELGKPRIDLLETQIQLLENTRERLDGYCDAVNTPVAESGLTPYVLYGQLLELLQIPGSDNWPPLRLPELAAWSASAFDARQAQVEELQARLRVSGIPTQHLFWGSTRMILLPTDQQQLRSALLKAIGALSDLREEVRRVSAQLGVAAPVTIAQARLLRDGLRRALEAPPPDLQFSSPEWVSSRIEVETMLSAGAAMAAIHERWDEVLTPDAWDQDMEPLRQQVAGYQSKWWRFLASGYRTAKSQLAGWCTGDVPKGVEAQVKLLDDMLEAQRQRAIAEARDELGSSLYGTHWDGIRSNWSQLRQWTEWIVGLREDIDAGRIPGDLPDVLEDPVNRDRLAPSVERLEARLGDHQDDREVVIAALQFDPQRRFGASDTLDDQPLQDQATLLADWSRQLNRLHEMVAFNVAADSCQRDGLGDIVAAATHWPEAGNHLVSLFRVARLTSLLERALTERLPLRGFDGAAHDQVAERFRELDQLNNVHNRAQLALRHWSALPRHDGGGQLAVLKREFAQKSRHLAIRQLMNKAGNAVQAIKPVFMMSPLSIATYLPPGGVEFDLVVFDEASQVRPVDGFGAVLRTRQAVVVGDSKQLPPTSFFDLVAQGDDIDEELVTGDVESILGLFLAKSAPQRMLRWHYRSRHESLITVSNHAFYEDRLVVFPSPDSKLSEIGLRFHHLPNTSYERGRSRTNPQEAQSVARAVMEHARTSPTLTLGVVAFSVAQQQTIVDQLELLRRQDPSCEPFFAAHPNEPFFVKNLENVQGDERDVIFISVGYGRTAEGYVNLNFGPLNQQGGERRLNVLITRARIRCEVFTNLTADDLDLTGTKSLGMRSLKQFLKYAQTGVLDLPSSSGGDAESPFEEAVYDALVSAGYEVDKQVGSAGFFIDLAVRDPDQQGRYALAIECDGATYHSARSTRDRDRLRQQVLEGLGWTFHRIWSTDWFRDSEQELRKTVAAIEMTLAKRSITRDPSPKPAEPAIEREHLGASPSEESGVDRYACAKPNPAAFGRSVVELSTLQVAEGVRRVIEVESPVHIEEVIHRITAASGSGRAGNRIRAAIMRAIDFTIAQGSVRRSGEFLWRADMLEAPVRDRSHLPNASRSLRFVAPEEIEQAVLRVIRDGYGVGPDYIPSATCRLLGFQRVSEDMNAQVQILVENLVFRGVLIRGGDYLKVNVNNT